MNDILKKFYEARSEEDVFDVMCCMHSFIEKKGRDGFFEEKISNDGINFKVLKNDYTVSLIYRILESEHFMKSVSSILKYQKEYRELKCVPEKILKDGYFVNLFLNATFYFIGFFSDSLKQQNIDFIGKNFWSVIKKIEISLSYEYSKVEILNAFEILIFDSQFFFKKNFELRIDGSLFYNNLKKTRLIIGNYLVDFSSPILLSSSFKKIISIKKKVGDDFSLKDSANRLQAIIKKFNFLRNGFDIDNSNELSSFGYFFKKRESRKILWLIELTIGGLNDFSHDEIKEKINKSTEIINEIKDYFYINYSVFPDYDGPSPRDGQWGNKSFLNTIKFFTLLSVAKKSDNNSWKIDVFLKYFNDWICDLDDNINYFSELDDYDKIVNILKTGENNLIEFKSTFGFPIEPYKTKDEYNASKKGIVEKIAKTILAMANSDGGSIFIGVVEKIERVRDEIKSMIVEKNGNYFLDVHNALRSDEEDFDSKRLQLQQILKNLTKERLDFLDALFSFHFHKIFIEKLGTCIEILEIKVKKSEKIIFLKKEDNWITLPKRLNGRVELINPAEEIMK